MSSIDCAYDEILRQKREDGAAEPSSKEAKMYKKSSREKARGAARNMRIRSTGKEYIIQDSCSVM